MKRKEHPRKSHSTHLSCVVARDVELVPAGAAAASASSERCLSRGHRSSLTSALSPETVPSFRTGNGGGVALDGVGGILGQLKRKGVDRLRT